MQLVRALRDQLHQMTHQLAWLDRQDVTGTNSRASAMRAEAAALRRDINEAKVFIDRLQRRYLNSDAQARRHTHDTKRALNSRAHAEVTSKPRIRPAL